MYFVHVHTYDPHDGEATHWVYPQPFPTVDDAYTARDTIVSEEDLATFDNRPVGVIVTAWALVNTTPPVGAASKGLV